MRSLSFTLLFLLSLMTVAPAQAASLQVSPVRFELPTTEASKPMWVSNSSSTPIQVQVRVYKWSQANGEETLSPTTEVVATPAMTELAPGGRQLVRIVRRGPAPTQEQAYRLLVEELPAANPVPLKPGQPALNLLLAYSLPVFLSPQAEQATPSLTAHVQGDALLLTNPGSRRVMVSDLKATTTDGKTHVVRAGLVGYVLAGQTMTFPFEAPAGTTRLSATVNQGDEQHWPLAH